MNTKLAARRGSALVVGAAILTSLGVTGCGMSALGLGGGATADDPTAAVIAKAEDVAALVGGATGFGGMLMDGYRSHMGDQMGFHSMADLVGDGETVQINLTNASSETCIFHVAYLSSRQGPDDESIDVEVPAGESVTTEIACSEILGLGSLEMPGAIACDFEDGESVDNMMAVPGFLGTDFTCKGSFGFHLMHDQSDLDGDGDTEEWVVDSDAMIGHMGMGGPSGHHHGM